MKIRAFAAIAFALLLSGCSMGPIRYSTCGYRVYLTKEWTGDAPAAVKPLAAIGGVVADAGVIALDTVAVPVCSIPVAFELMGPCPQPTTRDNVGIKLLTSPLWFTISYPMTLCAMPLAREEFYTERFGGEQKPKTLDRSDLPPDDYDAMPPSNEGTEK